MKKLLLLIFILSVSSCREEEIASYDDLTSDEQAEIRTRSRQKCLDTNTEIYQTFKEQSNVWDSRSYERAKGFLFEFKQGSSTEAKIKMDIRVWKRDATANEIYFYITETTLGTQSYFLRVTEAKNDEMISDLLVDHCDKFYTTTTGENGPLTVKYEYQLANSPNTDEYTDTYLLPFSSLAMFANFRLTRTVKTVNSEGDMVGSLVNYTSSLTAKEYDFEGRDVATNSAYYTQKFCDIDYETGTTFRFTQDASVLGFKKECFTTLPVGWDLVID